MTLKYCAENLNRLLYPRRVRDVIASTDHLTHFCKTAIDTLCGICLLTKRYFVDDVATHSYYNILLLSPRFYPFPIHINESY